MESKEDEKFYDLILAKTEEIRNMNIPEEKKIDLYKLIDETIQRYEEQKDLHIKKNLIHLAETWGKSYESLGKILVSAEELKKTLPTLEKTLTNLQKIKKSNENDLNNKIN
jgi:hypothetical protein